MNDVELAIRLTADADQASRAATDVGDSFGRMASDVDAATKKADGASSRMDSVADSADNMASRSSQAAGGMGDLGGALSLMPGPLGAVGSGMEAVSPAIMGVTGAADLMNLAMSSSIVVQAKAAVAAARQAIVSKAAAVATRVWAAAQWVLNRAFLGNPVLLALVAVAAIFVVLYKRSERFRSIVQAVMRGAQTAIGWVVDKVTNLGDTWQDVQRIVGVVIDWIRGKVDGLRDKVANVAGGVKDRLVGAFDAVKAPVEWLWDKVQDIVDWIGKIDFPSPPSWLPGVRAVAGGRTGTTTVTSTGPSIVNNINLYGVAASGDEVVRQLEAMFSRFGMQTGIVVA